MELPWRPPLPCQPGDDVKDIDTPALVIDLDKMDINLRKLQEVMKSFPGVAARPHAKAHKCPALAKLQVEHGAVGVCCQTLTEAEAMVYGGGPTDIFLTNQVIGKSKIKRLVKLAGEGDISVCVDDASNIHDISEVCDEFGGLNINCVVEVNVGQDRCGVEPGDAAVDLAKIIMDAPYVQFKGVHCYHGLNQHVRKINDRKAAVDKVVNLTKKTLTAFKEAGIDCNYVTGGGTGTFLFEAGSGVYTEVQPGSYLIMDVDYSKNFSDSDVPFQDFEQSLYVMSTVQSVSSDHAVLDAGMKAVSLDSGPPLIFDHTDLIYSCGGDEHGIVKPCGELKVGQIVSLVPGHCDPTVNMYDWIVGVRRSKIESVWPVLGRGPGV